MPEIDYNMCCGDIKGGCEYCPLNNSRFLCRIANYYRKKSFKDIIEYASDVIEKEIISLSTGVTLETPLDREKEVDQDFEISDDDLPF